MKKTCLLILFSFLVFCDCYGQGWNPVGNQGFTPSKAYNPTLALDTGGTPYVAFVDSAYGLMASVMRFNGSNWEYVGSPGFSNGDVATTAIAIDKNGTPYVVFQDNADSQKASVMKYDGSNWVYIGSRGFSDPGKYVQYTSIAVDTSGTPYVLYSEDTVGSDFVGWAVVMKYDGENWVNVAGARDLAVEMDFSTSLALDTAGMPYVAYEDGPDHDYLSVIRYNGSAWEYVGPRGCSAEWIQSPAIAIDKHGIPYVSYMGATNGETEAMSYNGSSWAHLASGEFGVNSGGFSAIAIDTDGTPYLVCANDSAGSADATDDIKVSKYSAASWEAVGSPFSAGLAQFFTMGIDNNGILYVAYQDWGYDRKATVMRYGWNVDVKNIGAASFTLTIFPNPTTNTFTLHISSPQSETATVTITNILGEKVKEITVRTNEDNAVMLNVAAGVYFVSAATGEGKMVQKVVVE